MGVNGLNIAVSLNPASNRWRVVNQIISHHREHLDGDRKESVETKRLRGSGYNPTDSGDVFDSRGESWLA